MNSQARIRRGKKFKSGSTGSQCQTGKILKGLVVRVREDTQSNITYS
jgi:hypothetical protein